MTDDPENKDLNRERKRPMPPEEYRFKPGQSGNPGGRPKEKPVTDELRRLMDREVPNDREGRTYAEVLAQAILHAALKGKVDAARELLDRIEGRVPHSVAAVVETPRENLTREQVEERLREILHRARERKRLADEEERQAAERALRGLPEPENPDA